MTKILEKVDGLKLKKLTKMTKQQIIRTLLANNTQKEFALKHGVTQQRISEWLRGIRNISNNNLETIAKNEGYLLTIELKLQKL